MNLEVLLKQCQDSKKAWAAIDQVEANLKEVDIGLEYVEVWGRGLQRRRPLSPSDLWKGPMLVPRVRPLDPSPCPHRRRGGPPGHEWEQVECRTCGCYYTTCARCDVRQVHPEMHPADWCVCPETAR